jgi:hypothetical protein
VELRILPATDSGGLINIHCIFNPDDTFLDKLENDFFASLDDSGGNKMNRAGLIALGKNSNDNLNDDDAYKKGIESFHLEPSKLIQLLKDKLGLKENTIRYTNGFYIFLKCFSEKSNAKAIKISANEIIILVCAFGMDMQHHPNGISFPEVEYSIFQSMETPV